MVGSAIAEPRSDGLRVDSHGGYGLVILRAQVAYHGILTENQWLSDEPAPDLSRNHSMKMLADSLAVYNLLSRLDAGLTPAAYKALLNQTTIGTAAGYERIVDGLEAALGINTAMLPVGNGQRDALYTAIYGIQANAAFGALQGKVQIVAPPINGLAAKTDFGALLSLQYLTPFALQGENLDGIWQSAQPDLFAQGQTDRNLPANDEQGVRNFSDQWLADRSQMLRGLMERYEQNQSGILVDHSLPQSTDYIDGATGLEVLVDNTSNTPLPSMRRDVVFGSDVRKAVASNDDCLFTQRNAA